MKNKAQQELVGFVLIVALVVVALLVFLVISLKSTPQDSQSLEAKNMLSSIMKTTTDCAINFEPNFDNYRKLFRSANKGSPCVNGQKAIDYLNQSLNETLAILLKTESRLSGYELTAVIDSGDDQITPMLKISNNKCNKNKKSMSAIETIITGSEKLLVRLKLCSA